MKIAEPPAPTRPLFYTDLESALANKEWKATCGPHSIAAASGKTLADVRAGMVQGGVNYRGWMSPTQVTNTLRALNVVPRQIQSKLKTMDLCNGINRVQREGKWLNPGVPPRVAYFHTHLVAHFDQWVLCTCCDTAKWIPEWEWRHFHLMCAKSPFHITHHWCL